MKFDIDFKQSKHQLITNSKQLKEAIKKCQEAGIFSFDVETAPKEAYRDNTIYPEAVFNPQQADIVTLSFSHDESFSYVVPIKHRKGVNYESEFDLWHQLKYDIFTNDKVLKLVFNAPFEFKFFTKYGVFCDKNLVDVHLLAVRISQVLRPDEVNPAMPNKGYGLKDLSLKYLNYEQTHFEDVLVANGAKFFDDLDIADGLEYSADDANLPIALWKIFKAEAEGVEIPALCNGVNLGERPYKNYYEWIANVESPATRCIGMMQCYGVGFNTSAADVMGIKVEREQDHARDELIKIGKKYGISLNPGKTGKSKSVKDFLYGTLGCPVLELTPAVGISMSAESIRDTLMLINMDIFDPNTLKNLEDITKSVQELEAKMKSIEDFAKEFGKTENMDKAYEQYSNNLIKINERYFKEHENKEAILETLKYINDIQHNGTLLSSHVKGRAKYVNPADSRVKPQYNTWTDTSRFASNKPNGQNLPRSDKDKFGIRSLHRPQQGHIFVAIDYQAQEVRIAADMYQEDHMIELINQGVDIHSATANGVFNLGLNVFEGDRAPKTERNAAKIALFGTFYGGSAYSLIKLYRNAGMYKSLKYCKDVINGLLKTYPGMDAFQNDVVDHASDVGYVETFLGYRRMLPLLSDDDELEIAVEKKWYKSHAQFMNRLKVSIDKILEKRDTTNDRKFDGEIKGASDIPTIDLHLIKDYLSVKKAAKYTNGQGFLEYYHDVENGSQMENILVYTINYIKKSEKRQLRSGTARKALNTPIQGSAADITKVGMNNVMNMFATGELDTDIVKFVASIHDENVFEINASAIDPKELDRIVHVLVDAMSGKVLKGLKVEQIAEPEIIDPYNVYGLEGEDAELCQGWSNKKDYYKWIEAVNNR